MLSGRWNWKRKIKGKSPLFWRLDVASPYGHRPPLVFFTEQIPAPLTKAPKKVTYQRCAVHWFAEFLPIQYKVYYLNFCQQTGTVVMGISDYFKIQSQPRLLLFLFITSYSYQLSWNSGQPLESKCVMQHSDLMDRDELRNKGSPIIITSYIVQQSEGQTFSQLYARPLFVWIPTWKHSCAWMELKFDSLDT